MRNIYILTDSAESGGTHTWMTNVIKCFTEINEADNTKIKYFVTNKFIYDFQPNSIIVCNNYYHKIFKTIDEKILTTLDIYFVVHGATNPGNTYFVDNIEYFTGIICVSELIKNFVYERIQAYILKNPNKKFSYFVLENYVDVKTITKPNTILTNSHTNTIVFNFVGRVSPEKNLPMLFYALAKLPKLDDKNNQINWFLNIWGDTSNTMHLNILNHIAKTVGIDNNIKFCGFSKNKDILYSDCSYVILPSVVEGSSYAVIEALAYGIPVIACNGVGDNDYQIMHGINGYLVNLGCEENKKNVNVSNNAIFNLSANISNASFNKHLKNVGYIEKLILKNNSRPITLFNKGVAIIAPTYLNINSEKFNKNVEKMSDVIMTAINNKLSIKPQTKINKDLFLQTKKNIFIN